MKHCKTVKYVSFDCYLGQSLNMHFHLDSLRLRLRFSVQLCLQLKKINSLYWLSSWPVMEISIQRFTIIMGFLAIYLFFATT